MIVIIAATQRRELDLYHVQTILGVWNSTETNNAQAEELHHLMPSLHALVTVRYLSSKSKQGKDTLFVTPLCAAVLHKALYSNSRQTLMLYHRMLQPL